MDTSAYLSSPRVLGHWIGGARTPAGPDLIDRTSPADGTLVAQFTDATRLETESAIAVARNAFDNGPWPHTSGIERGRVLLRLAEGVRRQADLLARMEIEESGKTARQAAGDVEAMATFCEYASGLAMQMHGDVYTNLGEDFTGLVTREPAGVVGMITPWNFPLLLLGQKAPFALGAGCTMVVKPSEYTSSTSLMFAELASEAGVPDGVINVVTGLGSTAGQILLESADVDMISFTGSTRTGRAIARASESNLKRLSLELGGKNANIVFADCDLDDAVDGVLFGVYFNQGECCVSGSRLLVEDSIADDFVTRVAESSRRLRVGSPFDPTTDIGAMIHENHLEKVLSYIDVAQQHGGRVVCGGKRKEEGGGLFVEPTVIDGVQPGTPIFEEEIFGPVLGVTRFASTEEAIHLANDVEYGLGNSIWTKNIDTALRVSRRLRSGTVWINTTIDGSPQLPGGGVKLSGYGREMGQVGFDEFTEIKTIQIRSGKRSKAFDV